MAYVVVIDQPTVSIDDTGVYTIGVTMTVTEDAAEVFDTSLSAKYDSSSGTIDDFTAALQRKLKKAWDQWKAENTARNSAALATAMATIQAAANTYVNA